MPPTWASLNLRNLQLKLVWNKRYVEIWKWQNSRRKQGKYIYLWIFVLTQQRSKGIIKRFFVVITFPSFCWNFEATFGANFRCQNGLVVAFSGERMKTWCFKYNLDIGFLAAYSCCISCVGNLLGSSGDTNYQICQICQLTSTRQIHEHLPFKFPTIGFCCAVRFVCRVMQQCIIKFITNSYQCETYAGMISKAEPFCLHIFRNLSSFTSNSLQLFQLTWQWTKLNSPCALLERQMLFAWLLRCLQRMSSSPFLLEVSCTTSSVFPNLLGCPRKLGSKVSK